MRCPKCGYISFDHNQICPKCNKDISDEQAKLNLPTYKSSPPSLLGMLVGAGDESNVGFTLDSDAALRNSGVGLDFEETSSMLDSSNLDFGEDDQDLEISLTDDTGEFELPEVDQDMQSGDVSDIDLGGGEEDLSLDMDEVSFEDSDDTADDLDLDLGEVSMDEGNEENDTADSLDGISPNDSIVLDSVPDISSEETQENMELDSGDSAEVSPGEEGKSTVELNVSDLKINETGELEINSIPDEILSPGNLPEEDEINIDEDEIEIDADESFEKETSLKSQMDGKNVTGSLDLSDLSLDASDNLPLDKVGGSDTAELTAKDISNGDEDMMTSETMEMGAIIDDEGLDLGDLALNTNDTGELQLSDLEENKSEKGSELNDIKIDLENLDLDLDLDDSEDNK